MSQPPEVDAIREELARSYRKVQENEISELERIAGDPNQARYRARLTEQSRAVGVALDEVDLQAQRWAATRLPEAYQIGAREAAAATGKPYTWSKIHVEAVAEIAKTSYSDLLKATRFVRRDVKRFIRAAVRERTNASVIGGRTSTQAGRDLAKLLEDRGVKAIRYKNGALHTLKDYSDTSIRTAVAMAHNLAVINHSTASGVRYFAISDGLGCGWSAHNDSDLAAGSVRTLEEVSTYPISHPRCVMPGTEVVPYGEIEEIVRARYSGPCHRLTVATDSGLHTLAIGPNHPVLTGDGWKAAHLVAEGDQLVYDTWLDHSENVGLEADLEQVPAIEDLFGALSAVGGTSLAPATSDDLHGDARFTDGEIEVVRSARRLLVEGDAPDGEKASKDPLMRPDVDLLGVLRLGVRLSFASAVAPSPSRIVGGSEEAVVVSGVPLIPRQFAGLGEVSADAKVSQVLSDRSSMNPELSPDRPASHLADYVEIPKTFRVDWGMEAGIRTIPSGVPFPGLDGERDAATLALNDGARRTALGHGAVEGTELPPLAGLGEVLSTESAWHGPVHRFVPAPVVSVEVIHHEGWVYDLTTTGGTFASAGCKTMNCARAISPLPLVTTPDEAKAARQYLPEEQARLASAERERAKVRTVTGRLTARERDRRASLRRRESRLQARQSKVRR